MESERQIAARCADSLSLRGFLGYALDEATPDHSSMSVIRQRLGSECFERVFALVLAALQQHGLLKGRHLGIDSSVIEANASLRSLTERNTEEGYWAYVQRLAREAGVETNDGAALRNFDRKRAGKKMSNEQWQNPHDPDAKIGRTKDGATDMVYLPEHTVDLDTGAIVQAQVLAGDHRDSEELSARVIEAVVNVQEALADPEALPETLTGRQRLLLAAGDWTLAGTEPQDGDQRSASCPTPFRQAQQRATPDPGASAAFGEQQVWQEAPAQAGPAHRTQLCPCARCRRDAAGHLAGAGEPEQAPSDRRRLLQSLPAPAPALRSGNPEAVGGVSFFFLLFAIAGRRCLAVQTRNLLTAFFESLLAPRRRSENPSSSTAC